MTTQEPEKSVTNSVVAEKVCLSTVGIHPVFLRPQDFEIVGQLKCKPEDFVVVERGQDGRYAELTDAQTLPDVSNAKEKSNGTEIDTEHTKASAKDESLMREDDESFFNSLKVSNVPPKIRLQNLMNYILSDDDPAPPNQLLDSIQALHDLAAKKISHLAGTTSTRNPATSQRSEKGANCTVDPTDNDDNNLELSERYVRLAIRLPDYEPLDGHSSTFDLTKKRNKFVRGKLHHFLKEAYPLLRSINVKHSKGATVEKSIDGKLDLIDVKIDSTFFDLSSYLENPVRGILLLYQFCHKRQFLNDGEDSKVDLVLPLLPNIGKEERRTIHGIISKGCRDLQTDTRHTQHGEQSPARTEILVKWARQGSRGRKRKRKLSGKPTSGRENVLCVIKKQKVEHLACIKHLTSIIRCGTSDIGMGGIKDMFAVTSQFVTFRGVEPKRLRSSNSLLVHKGIELGNFEWADKLLTTGNLQGNRFELVLRKIGYICGEKRTEVFKCQYDQIEAAVRRVRSAGFINFFGEQRVGFAGNPEKVGVRSFEVGRAMLQGEYMAAIDLVMSGRQRNKGEWIESEEVREVRSLWKKSNGDVTAVLKAMSKNSAMHREKQLLQGLKRYNDPYRAICTLPYSVRLFWGNAYQSYVWNIVASERFKRYGSKVAVGDLYIDDSGNIFAVTEPSKIEIEQIVLPLPGYQIVYPGNDIGQFYSELLQNDNIVFDKGKPAESTAKGCYRRFISFATNIEWECVKSKNELVEEALFKFELQKGSYATMFMRELMAVTRV